MEPRPVARVGSIPSDAVAEREDWPRWSAAALRAAPLSTKARRERNRRLWRKAAAAIAIVAAALALGMLAGPWIAQWLYR